MGSSLTWNSGLLELKRKLNGAFAAGGVYDQRGLFVCAACVPSSVDVGVESSRLWTTAAGKIELGQAAGRRAEQETALNDRVGSFEAIVEMLEMVGRPGTKEGEFNSPVRLFVSADGEDRGKNSDAALVPIWMGPRSQIPAASEPTPEVFRNIVLLRVLPCCQVCNHESYVLVAKSYPAFSPL